MRFTLPFPRNRPLAGGVGPTPRDLRNANQRFYRTLNRWKKEVPDMMDTITKLFVMTVAENIIIGGPYGNPTGTPVDTSRARNNYYMRVNGQGSDPQVGYDEARADPTRGEDHLITDIFVAVMSAPLGARFSLANRVPYFRRLEYGWSKQAPVGMVRLVRMNAQIIMDDVAREVVK